MMGRILAFAVCGLSLGACTSSDVLRLGQAERTPVTLRLESQPAGADATVAGGGSCKTPCSVPVNQFGELSVTYALEGYEPQEVAVQIVQPADPRDGSARANPNPVYVEFEALPGQARRRPPARKTAARPPAQPAPKKSSRRAPAPSAAAPPPPEAQPAPAALPAPASQSPWPALPGSAPTQPQQ
jgi:hypothetical protein